MTVRDCVVVAVEGAQASGKTTLALALVAHCRENGINAGYAGEAARVSPFIDEIVLHGVGTFDVVAEADLFGAQLSAQLRAARGHQLLVADKTIMNVPAHVRALLDMSDVRMADICMAMETFCRAMRSMYDAVVYCADEFRQDLVADPLRSKVVAHRKDIDVQLREVLQQVGTEVMLLPLDLPTPARVHWTSDQLETRGLLGT